MKRSRHGGAIIAITILMLVALVLTTTSVQQNLKVRVFFYALFNTVQSKDHEKIQSFFTMQKLSGAYLDQLCRYDLRGWKITKIGGQPWPLDQGEMYIPLTAELYYHLPAALLKPYGPYEKIEHPKYGPCGVVPVLCKYYYDKETGGWELLPPNKDSKINYLAPIEPPASGKPQVSRL